MSKRVLLGDHRVFHRQALRAVLEHEQFTVVAEASDGLEAVGLARSREVDLALLEMQLPRVNGPTAARQMLRSCPGIAVILLGDMGKASLLGEAIRAGVRGFVSETQTLDDLVRTLHEVSRGGFYVAPGAPGAVMAAWRGAAVLPRRGLTFRGRQVLQLIAEGKTTKQVAALLQISVKTADYHRTQIMKALDIHETAGLVRYAIRQGLAAL